MKKLGKRLNYNAETIEAYCSCSCSCDKCAASCDYTGEAIATVYYKGRDNQESNVHDYALHDPGA